MSYVVAFTGSRDWSWRALVRNVIETMPEDTVVVVGDARGADAMVKSEAERAHLFVARVEAKPHWRHFGKSAGMRRNAAMVRLKPSLVIAFWDGRSPGTRGMIDLARRAGLIVRIYYSDGKIETLRGKPPMYFDAPI